MIALDTNILIYAVSRDPAKTAVAQSIILRAVVNGGVLPMQVLAEFANACRRKHILTAAPVQARIREFADTFHIVGTTPNDITAAVATADRYQLSFFDALICNVAAAAGAQALLSEDMQDGARIDMIEIIDPFNPANAGRLDQLLGA